jgi:hypothetical protein
MRKLMLISALLLASAAAQASDRGMVLAAADTPAATTTDAGGQATAQPLPPSDASKPQVSEQTKPRASKPRSQVRRHESDEAKARRIAAKYGVSW